MALPGNGSKLRQFIYITPSRETAGALRHGSHSFTCKQHHACLYLESIRQMALPVSVVTDILIATYYSFIVPETIKG